MPTDTAPRSARRLQMCSRKHADRVAGQLFDQRRESVSIVTTNDPLQPLRVVRSTEVTDPSTEIAVVTG